MRAQNGMEVIQTVDTCAREILDGDREKNYGDFFGTFHISTHKRLFGVAFLRIDCRQKHTVLLISSYE